MIYFACCPQIYPGKILVTSGPWNHMGIKQYTADAILKWDPSLRNFKIEKDRHGNGASVSAEKYFGLTIDGHGQFMDKDIEILFLLKYGGGIKGEIMVDFPLI